jgi:hypothetical protein
MNNHLLKWLLKGGTFIEFNGVTYSLDQDTHIRGNISPSEATRRVRQKLADAGTVGITFPEDQQPLPE